MPVQWTLRLRLAHEAEHGAVVLVGAVGAGQGQAAPFALGSAQSIEVLRGPFSALYGSSSGGVILVQTMDGPEVPTGEIDFYYGTYGTSRTALKFGG